MDVIVRRYYLLSLYLVLDLWKYTDCTTSISAPSAGNCEEDTVLTCHVEGSLSFTGWFGLGRELLENGTPYRPVDSSKYTETRGTSSFTLTIHKTAISDEGSYKCKNSFSESQLVLLNIECKASAVVLTVTSGKKVSITVDKLYPASPRLSATLKKKNNPPVTVTKPLTCSNSIQYQGYYICTLLSSTSLADGSYTYSLVVTTITQAEPLTGSFSIVSPQTPAVSNSVNLTSNREVVYGNEGQSLTIECTSSGGLPAPMVAWYKNSVSTSNQMSFTSSGNLQGDGTYKVTLQHTFTPTASDDLKTLICRSYYPQADSAHRGSKTKSVVLYLALKPSHPTVTQKTVVSAGGRVEVSCTITGCRPAANISWSYQGSTVTGQVTSTLDAPTETYTVVSLFRRQMTAADNGRVVQCVVTHPALVIQAEGIGSAELNIQFSVKASTTKITGNQVTIATGRNELTLNCTTGSSNPASDIVWKTGSVTISNNQHYTNWKGENNGIVRSQNLVLKPTRYMDQDVITCSVSNILNLQKPVIDTAKLNLHYRPMIKYMPAVVVVEGNKTELICSASSKPVSTFKWYRGQSGILHQGTGTHDDNKLIYTINNVRRTDAATYRCNAHNGIETPDNETVVLIVYYPPDVTPETRNTSVKNNTAVITCNAKGVPDTNYEYQQWEQRWPGYDDPVSKKPGSDKLVLINLTYEHSGVYTCSASNGIRDFDTDKKFMKGSVHLLVKSFPIITNISEKTSARLKENATVEVNYYSNIEGSEVKIYRTANNSRQKEVICNVSQADEEVNLPVFERTIKTGGTKAQIMIPIHLKEDLGFYDVVIANEMGSRTKTFELVPKGPPSDPYNVTVDEIQHNKAHLSWIRGYHGGFDQTFVIQMSTDLKKWKIIEVFDGKNEGEEPISKNLLDLHDSTTYYIQIYAFNREGNSSLTENNFTTLSKIEDTNGISSAVIGGAAVGGSALFLIIIVAVVVFILKRRGVFSKGKGISHDDKTDRKPVYTDENDDGMQDNPMYVSAGPREQTPGGSGLSDVGAVYSTVDKKKSVLGNDVYAHVDKLAKTNVKQGKKEKTEQTKRGFKKDKKGKKVMQEGDLYENATTTEMKDRLAQQNKNDETIYENPEPTKQAVKKNVNKDGLIYADLTFNDQPKGQKKLVIHGLDSMTEYVEVDFTKKADPLPDSDDESNLPKK